MNKESVYWKEGHSTIKSKTNEEEVTVNYLQTNQSMELQYTKYELKEKGKYPKYSQRPPILLKKAESMKVTISQ